jgi:hypothetical protein
MLYSVIPNRLLASAYPGEKDPEAHQLLIRRMIIGAGIQVVVNTMETEELKTCTPYQETMLEHAKEGIIIDFTYLAFIF